LELVFASAVLNYPQLLQSVRGKMLSQQQFIFISQAFSLRTDWRVGRGFV